MSAYVYILIGDNGRFYIGCTTNLYTRMQAHLAKSTLTTARMKSFKLILVQKYASKSIALKIERRIKNLKRKDYIEKMVKEGYINMMP